MKIVFDSRIKTCDGLVCGVDVLPSEVQSIEYATSTVDSVREAGMIQRNENLKQAEKSKEWHQQTDSLIRKRRTVDINEYHKALGHLSKAITFATAHAEDISSKGNFNPCENCTLGKARQANVNKKAIPT